MNTLLIGLRGCGKSTVGRRLAELLGRSFVDLDEQVLAAFPEATVSEVWSVRGESAWRKAEARALAEWLRGDRQIVALGGGTPMIDEARRLIEAEQRSGRAIVVYLRCEASELARRIRSDRSDRPSLTGADPIEEIAAVLAAREPTYHRLADIELDVTTTSAEEAARALSKT